MRAANVISVGASRKSSKMSAEEKRWQTEDDARALLRAEEVKSDKSRYAAARAALREAVSQAQAAAGGVGKK